MLNGMAKSKRKRLTDRLDEVCLKVIRLRDNNKCQKCGKAVSGSDSQQSHVVCKGNGASLRRWDLLNIFLSCGYCHLFWWHKEVTEAGKWFAKKYPARESYLEIYRYGKPAKISTADMETLYEVLKQKLKDLQSEG